LQEQAESLSQAVSIFELGEGRPVSRKAPPAVERRGPNRAKNVVRLPKASEPPAPPAAAAVGDEWQQF
jgi:methyl-accepting chemotaxis protein